MNRRWCHRPQHLKTISLGLSQERLHTTHRSIQACYPPRRRKMQLSSLHQLPAGKTRMIPSHQCLCRHRIRAAQKNDSGRRCRQHRSIRPLSQCLTGGSQVWA